MSGPESSHVDGVVAQHQAQLRDPSTTYAQKEASKDAITRLQAGSVSDRELGSNTPTPEERASRDQVAEDAASVAESAAKALPQDGPRQQ